MSERILEAAHDPGGDVHWEESWYVDFCDESGRGGFLRLARRPAQRTAWLWACLVTPGRLVLVRDHDVPPPRGGGLEVRSSGLWADLVCETPMIHWSFGLEAFGVELDDPLDAYHGELGHRVPLGFDLEWEATAPPFEHPGASGRAGAGHYQHPGRVHGEVLVGDETIDFDGSGERDHAWGPRNWWELGWHWAAFRLEGGKLAVNVARPDLPGSEHATGYVAEEGGDPHPVVRAGVRTQFDAGGIPVSASYEIETDLEVDVEVLAPAPLAVPDPDGGRTSRLARALCRFTTSEATGTGWAEWLRVDPVSAGKDAG